MENLHFMSVNDLSEAIRTMNLSPSEIVTQLLDRSERFNNQLQIWQTLDKNIPLMQAGIREKEILKGNYIGYYKVSFIQIPLNLFIKECTYYNKKSISVLKIYTAENSSP